MKNNAPDKKESRPCLVVSSRRVTRVNAGFTELTGYSRKEVVNADFETVLSLLRLTGRGCASSWIFTKTLEPREVVVSRQADSPAGGGTEETYTFCEITHSRLEEALPYAYRLLEENMTGVAVYSAEDLTLLKANQSYLDFCGEPFREPEKAIGRTIGAFFGGCAGSPVEEAVGRSLTAGKSEAVRELRFGRSDGGETYCDLLITPVKADGRIKYVVINMQDATERVSCLRQSGRLAAVTELKKEVDQLKKSEAVLRSVLDNSRDFIYSLNTQTNTYEYVSPSAEKVLGCSAETFMATDAKTLFESIHPDDRSVLKAALRTLEEKNETEIRFRQFVNGEYRWFSNHLTDVRDENGRILYRNGRIRDITEQVKSYEVIRYQAGLLQSISDIIISSDENNVIKSWNRAAELTFGWTEEEALGQQIHLLLKTQIVGQTFEEAYAKLLQGRKVEIETIDTCKDGRKLNIICSPQLIRDANGKIKGVVGIFRDVTEKKKMEDALREKETHLRLATEAAKLGTYAFNFKKGTTFLSEELKALWGVLPGEPAEFDDMAFYKGLHPDDKQLFRDKIIAANDPNGDGLIEYDYRVVLPDGAVKWLHTRGQTAFEDIGGRRVPVYAAGVVIDITERVAAENSIREISEELRIIMESTEDYIYLIDRDKRLLFFNSAYSSDVLRIFGKKLEKGMRISDAIPKLDDAYWESIFERVADEGKVYLEANIDNGTRVMQFSFNPVYIDGQLTEIAVFGRDITERINSEREIIRLNTTLEKRVQERTEELQKSISDLKNLSRIISHDLKEPIRQIGYYAEHIQLLTEKGPIRSEADDIKKTCGRMTRLIDALSEFAMSSELKIKKEPVNVKKMASAVFNELKASAENKTRLQFESGLPVVNADSLLLRRVLYNLLSNAVKFSSKREMPEVTIGCTEENGQYVFYIRDNGVGFDMQYAHKLYNAFERLHSEEEFEGSGMGLAAVRNIIERHGGRTWIESREDAGTTVYFTLPV